MGQAFMVAVTASGHSCSLWSIDLGINRFSGEFFCIYVVLEIIELVYNFGILVIISN